MIRFLWFLFEVIIGKMFLSGCEMVKVWKMCLNGCIVFIFSKGLVCFFLLVVLWVLWVLVMVVCFCVD